MRQKHRFHYKQKSFETYPHRLKVHTNTCNWWSTVAMLRHGWLFVELVDTLKSMIYTIWWYTWLLKPFLLQINACITMGSWHKNRSLVNRCSFYLHGVHWGPCRVHWGPCPQSSGAHHANTCRWWHPCMIMSAVTPSFRRRITATAVPPSKCGCPHHDHDVFVGLSPEHIGDDFDVGLSPQTAPWLWLHAGWSCCLTVGWFFPLPPVSGLRPHWLRRGLDWASFRWYDFMSLCPHLLASSFEVYSTITITTLETPLPCYESLYHLGRDTRYDHFRLALLALGL